VETEHLTPAKLAELSALIGPDDRDAEEGGKP
jgi:hypothetical protein